MPAVHLNLYEVFHCAKHERKLRVLLRMLGLIFILIHFEIILLFIF
jgi:hypothetical protein